MFEQLSSRGIIDANASLQYAHNIKKCSQKNHRMKSDHRSRIILPADTVHMVHHYLLESSKAETP